jgi:putative pyruvate formate lyase activating enzyme
MEYSEYLNRCNLCPNNCNVNRNNGEIGFCRNDSKIKVALASLHYYEEPCISGTNGSGTVFFTNCNMKCVFCQNYRISQEEVGNDISIEELADKFIMLQNMNAHNINLVSPTPHVIQIINAIKIAREKGLNIPIIYNCGGYENVDTIKLLNGYIDVYLPDFKYSNNELGKKYSGVNNYFDCACSAIKEMYKQVGAPVFDEKGIIKKGVIIRTLILPMHIQSTKDILKWISSNLGDEVYISVMAQYFPTYKAKEYKLINRKINRKEYNEVESYLFSLNFKNGYIQDLGKNEESYVPNFEA